MPRGPGHSTPRANSTSGLWKPPHELTVAKLQLTLSKHGVPYNKAKDRKPRLMELYLKLAEVKVPQEVSQWSAHKSVSALPPPAGLAMHKIRSLLTQYGVPHSHAKLRASLVDLYESLRERETVIIPLALNPAELDVEAAPNDHLGKHVCSGGSSSEDARPGSSARIKPPSNVSARPHSARRKRPARSTGKYRLSLQNRNRTVGTSQSPPTRSPKKKSRKVPRASDPPSDPSNIELIPHYSDVSVVVPPPSNHHIDIRPVSAIPNLPSPPTSLIPHKRPPSNNPAKIRQKRFKRKQHLSSSGSSEDPSENPFIPARSLRRSRKRDRDEELDVPNSINNFCPTYGPEFQTLMEKTRKEPARKDLHGLAQLHTQPLTSSPAPGQPIFTKTVDFSGMMMSSYASNEFLELPAAGSNHPDNCQCRPTPLTPHAALMEPTHCRDRGDRVPFDLISTSQFEIRSSSPLPDQNGPVGYEGGNSLLWAAERSTSPPALTSASPPRHSPSPPPPSPSPPPPLPSPSPPSPSPPPPLPSPASPSPSPPTLLPSLPPPLPPRPPRLTSSPHELPSSPPALSSSSAPPTPHVIPTPYQFGWNTSAPNPRDLPCQGQDMLHDDVLTSNMPEANEPQANSNAPADQTIDASAMTASELKSILKQRGLSFGPSTRLSSLVATYNMLSSSPGNPHMNCSSKRKTPPSTSEHEGSIYIESGSDDDENDSQMNSAHHQTHGEHQPCDPDVLANKQSNQPVASNSIPSTSTPNPRLSMWRESVANPDQTPANGMPLDMGDCGETSTSKSLIEAFTSFKKDCSASSSKLIEYVGKIVGEVSDIRTTLQNSVPRNGFSAAPQPSQIPAPARRAPRSGKIRYWIHFHCATLFGSCLDSGRLPEPATEAEKESWNQDAMSKVNATNEDSDSSSSVLSSALEDVDVDGNNSDEIDSDSDPCFPYGPSGPGHREATSQALSIIWRGMQSAGVKSFRPDLSGGISSADNKFLWELAFNLFLKLVRCGEYDGISLSIDGESQVSALREAFRTYVKGRLMRRYREENKWSAEQSDGKAQRLRRTTRLSKLKQRRVKFLLNQPGFLQLSSIVEACCSDDETIRNESESDDDSPDSDAMDCDEPATSKKKKSSKKFSVLKIPWRHHRLDAIIKQIDYLMSSAANENTAERRTSKHPPRTRERPTNPTESKIKPVLKLPGNCYNLDWLNALPTEECRKIRMKSKEPVDLVTCLEMLERL